VPPVAPSANPARYASGGQPAYQGQTTASVVPADASTANGGLQGTGAANVPHMADGCGVCGSGDVQYVLETDVGVDAATLAGGNIVRAAFCSVDCLAEKLGLARGA
jgi:hypothetical protein